MTTDYDSVESLLDDAASWDGKPVARTARVDDHTTLTVTGRARWGYRAFAEYSDGVESATAGRGTDGDWKITIRLTLADLQRNLAADRVRAVSRAQMLRRTSTCTDHLARAVLDAAPGEYTLRALRDELIVRALDAGVDAATVARSIGTGRDAVYRAIAGLKATGA